MRRATSPGSKPAMGGHAASCSRKSGASGAQGLMTKHRIFTTSFASVYPHYVQKAARKGRDPEDVNRIICWLTGYSPQALAEQIERRTDFETFFGEAPALNPKARAITGTICGVRIEE